MKIGCIVEINRLCNYHCVFCNVPNQHLQIDLERFKEYIERYRKVGISGGEPLLHPRLRDIILCCADKQNVVIATNLSKLPDFLLQDEGFHSRGIYERLYFQINLPCLDQQLFSEITRSSINLAVILDNIEKIMERSGHVIINVVVTSMNSNEEVLYEFVRYFEGKNLYALRFHPVILLRKDHQYLYQDNVFEILEKVRKRAREEGKKLHEKIIYPGIEDINALLKGKLQYDYITLEGKVFPSLFHAWCEEL
jgi:molybdenum cofactor biosynthesis enzyme MoaA